MYKCSKCKKELEENETYEYRGAFSCAEHFDDVQKNRDTQRQKIIDEESVKTEVFRGLDLSDSSIGKANREILKRQLEIAKKESGRLKEYESPTHKCRTCKDTGREPVFGGPDRDCPNCSPRYK